MKNKFKFLLSLMALMLTLAVLSSCGAEGISLEDVNEDPIGALEDAFDLLADDIDKKYGDIFAAFEDVEDSVSSQSLSVSVPDTLNASLELNSDYKNKQSAGKLTIGAEGISAEASVWVKDKCVVLSVPALLGDGKYGVDLATLSEDIKTAPILNAFGITYDELAGSANPETDDDGLTNGAVTGQSVLGIVLESLAGKGDGANVKDAIEKYKNDVIGELESVKATVAEETVGDTEVITIQYTYDKETAKTIVNKTFDSFADVLSNLAAVSGSSADEAKQEILGAIDADFKPLTAKYYLVKDSGRLLKMDTSMDTLTAVVNFSSDSSNPLNITSKMSSKGEDSSAEFTYTITEGSADGKKTLSASVSGKSVYADEEVKGEYGIVLSLGEEDALTIEISQDGETLVTAKGSLSFGKDSFELAIDTVENSDGESITLNFKYSLSTGADLTVEELPEYKKILDLTADDLETIAEEIEASPIGSLFFGQQAVVDSQVAVGGSLDDVYGDYGFGEEVEDDLEDVFDEYEDELEDAVENVG